MNTSTASLLALALAFSGMAALGFAMDRHAEQLSGRRDAPSRQRVLLRGLGGLLIAGALVPSLLAWGASVGTVAWLGFLSAGALCVALLMAYVPRAAAMAAVLSAVAGVAGTGLYLAAPLIRCIANAIH